MRCDLRHLGILRAPPAEHRAWRAPCWWRGRGTAGISPSICVVCAVRGCVGCVSGVCVFLFCRLALFRVPQISEPALYRAQSEPAHFTGTTADVGTTQGSPDPRTGTIPGLIPASRFHRHYSGRWHYSTGTTVPGPRLWLGSLQYNLGIANQLKMNWQPCCRHIVSLALQANDIVVWFTCLLRPTKLRKMPYSRASTAAVGDDTGDSR